MFSLKPCDELVFSASPTSQLETNLISFSAAAATDDKGFRSRRRQSRNECDIRRGIVHREYERKKREHMTNLYAFLRALLPLEPNKGKIYVINQMEEAANYIKQMHNKIQQLRSRRDELKKLEKSSFCGRNNVESSNSCKNVSLHQFLDDGFEILIRNESSEFELSQFLAELPEDREIDVVSCVSTRTDAGFLHRIEIQAKDMTSYDVSALHDRLTDVIK